MRCERYGIDITDCSRLFNTPLISCQECIRDKQSGDGLKNALLEAMKRKGLRKSARLLGVSAGTVTYWIKKGNIPDGYIQGARKSLGVAI